MPLKADLPDGVYTVAWRTVSAVDGHLATGSFAFGIGVAPPAPVARRMRARPRPRPDRRSARSSAAGCSTSASSACSGWPSSAPSGRPWLAGVGPARPAGRLADRGDRHRAWSSRSSWAMPASTWHRVFETSFGAGHRRPERAHRRRRRLARPVVWLRRTPRAVGPGRSSPSARPARWSPTSPSATPRPAATRCLDVPVQVLHVVAVGLWLGGLLGLLVNLRGEPTEDDGPPGQRFSRLATVGHRHGGADRPAPGDRRDRHDRQPALDRLRAPGHRQDGPAGRARPASAPSTTSGTSRRPAGRSAGLRRIGSAELLARRHGPAPVGLAGQPGPADRDERRRSTPARRSSRSSLTGSDFGTSLKVRLDVSPGAAGFNTFKATVTDYDTGAALASATSVSLRFTFPGRADVGSSRLDLPATAPRRLQRHRLEPLARRGLAGHGPRRQRDRLGRGPFELITRTAPATIDVNAVAGLPTIYTVHLSAGRSVQVYLDPGTAGANEVHSDVLRRRRQRAPGRRPS